MRLAVGELAAVEPDLLTFAWEAIVGEGPDAGAALEIEWRPGRQFCHACRADKRQGEGSWLRVCLDCGAPLRIEGGTELDVMEIEHLPAEGRRPDELHLDVRRRALAANEAEAALLRQGFAGERTLVTNLISSPGCGKTTLLEATVAGLAGRGTVGVIEGDIATERDADRLRACGLPAHQILTGGSCHLDARQVGKALNRPPPAARRAVHRERRQSDLPDLLRPR